MPCSSGGPNSSSGTAGSAVTFSASSSALPFWRTQARVAFHPRWFSPWWNFDPSRKTRASLKSFSQVGVRRRVLMVWTTFPRPLDLGRDVRLAASFHRARTRWASGAKEPAGMILFEVPSELLGSLSHGRWS